MVRLICASRIHGLLAFETEPLQTIYHRRVRWTSPDPSCPQVCLKFPKIKFKWLKWPQVVPFTTKFRKLDSHLLQKMVPPPISSPQAPRHFRDLGWGTISDPLCLNFLTKPNAGKRFGTHLSKFYCFRQLYHHHRVNCDTFPGYCRDPFSD